MRFSIEKKIKIIFFTYVICIKNLSKVHGDEITVAKGN